MAPRETIPASTNRSLVEGGVTTAAQREALLKSTPPPYSPPKIDWKLKDVPVGESCSTFSMSESSAQAQALQNAAKDGTPFCEECAKAGEEPAAADVPDDGPGGDDWETD